MFTRSEFEKMTAELLDEKCVRFDTLCAVAEKTLRRSVEYWCASDGFLRGCGYENDIMQEIFLRLIKTCKTSFFLRDGVDGPVNNDPDGFKSWMFRVAINVKKDFSRAVWRREMHSAGAVSDDSITGGGDIFEDVSLSEERIKRLREAFAVVLESEMQVYKVLTWLALCIFILENGSTQKESSGEIIKCFENKTLGEMYASVKNPEAKISWLAFSEEQSDRIEKQLSEQWDSARKYADVTYGEFFMKKGGKASVSDWMNRMNNFVKRMVKKDGTPDN